VARPDENFRKSGRYVRTKFQKILLIYSDRSCTKKVNFCSDGPSGRPKIQICSDQPIRPPKTAILFGSASKNCCFTSRRCKCYIKSLCVHLHITRPASTFLVSRYNSFDRPQYILKFSPQLIEDLKLRVIKGECSAILAESGCCSQGVKESV
jgi:hypothetical protein